MARIPSSFVATVLCISGAAHGVDTQDTYPVLAIPRAAGTDSLLNHELTPKERALFNEIDVKTAQLPHNATSDQYRAVAVEVGRLHGLTPEQSIAFFVRTTFSEFER